MQLNSTCCPFEVVNQFCDGDTTDVTPTLSKKFILCGRPFVIIMDAKQLSVMSVHNIRISIIDGLSPFMIGGWRPEERNNMNDFCKIYVFQRHTFEFIMWLPEFGIIDLTVNGKYGFGNIAFSLLWKKDTIATRCQM